MSSLRSKARVQTGQLNIGCVTLAATTSLIKPKHREPYLSKSLNILQNVKINLYAVKSPFRFLNPFTISFDIPGNFKS